MPHRKGTFRENLNDLLQRFATRGTPALFEQAKREKENKGEQRTDRPIFRLNKSLEQSREK